MRIGDFKDKHIFAVMAGNESLTPDEREFLVTDTPGFEESNHSEAEYRAMSDRDLMRAVYWTWSDYAKGQV